MSVDEDEWLEAPSRVMIRGNSNDFPYSLMSEVSLGKSIPQFISSSPLRMINSEYTALSLNQSAFLPS